MRKESSRYLRWTVNIWTAITFGVVILDAVHGNELEAVLGPVLAIYTGALVLYSAEKEFERWRLYFIGRHPGEVYVLLWTILMLGAFLWSLITGGAYKVSPEIISTYIVVLGVLAITKKSKEFFKEKTK